MLSSYIRSYRKVRGGESKEDVTGAKLAMHPTAKNVNFTKTTTSHKKHA